MYLHIHVFYQTYNALQYEAVHSAHSALLNLAIFLFVSCFLAQSHHSHLSRLESYSFVVHQCVWDHQPSENCRNKISDWLSLKSGTKWMLRISENPSVRAGATKCFLFVKGKQERRREFIRKDSHTAGIKEGGKNIIVLVWCYSLIALENHVTDFVMFAV